MGIFRRILGSWQTLQARPRDRGRAARAYADAHRRQHRQGHEPGRGGARGAPALRQSRRDEGARRRGGRGAWASTASFAMRATLCADSRRVPASPSWPSSLWRSASAPTPPSSSCWTRCACAACPSQNAAGSGRTAHRRRQHRLRRDGRPLRAVHHSHVAGGSPPSRSFLRRLCLAARTTCWSASSATRKQVHGLEVSGEFFNVLGVAPWQGRLIEPQDEAGVSDCRKSSSAIPIWKIADGRRAHYSEHHHHRRRQQRCRCWASRLRRFFGLIVGDRFDLAYPTCMPPNPRREMFIFSVMGRLKPGWTIDRASAYFGVAQSRHLREHRAHRLQRARQSRSSSPSGSPRIRPDAGVSTLRDAYDSSLQLLLAITGLVLLIACANLANLMLARASARQREMAIRMALGASRRRLLRQLLIESGLLAVSGAALGVALAQPLSRLLVASLNTSQDSIHLSIATDWRVLLFAASVAALTCIVFGTLPRCAAPSADPITVAQVRRARDRRQPRALLHAAPHGRHADRGLDGAAGRRAALRPQLSQPHDHRPRHARKRHHRWLLRLSRAEDQAGKRSGVQTRSWSRRCAAFPAFRMPLPPRNTPLGGSSWSHDVHVGDMSKARANSPMPAPPTSPPWAFLCSAAATSLTRTPTMRPSCSSSTRPSSASIWARRQPIGQLVHVMPEPQYPERTYQIVGTIADTKYNDLREDTPPMAFVPAAQFPVTAQGPGMAMMIASNDRAGRDHRRPAHHRKQSIRR